MTRPIYPDYLHHVVEAEPDDWKVEVSSENQTVKRCWRADFLKDLQQAGHSPQGQRST